MPRAVGRRYPWQTSSSLQGCAGVEQAAKNAGHDVQVPFSPGRTDASEEWTDAESFDVLEPTSDGFRNYGGNGRSAEDLVEKAYMLTLTAPEMTALVGGMRALNANSGGSQHGVFTDRPGALTNDFFTNLLDMSTQWSPSDSEGVFEGRDRRRVTLSGPPQLLTSSSAPTRSFGPWPRSTAATMASSSSSAISSPPGIK